MSLIKTLTLPHPLHKKRSFLLQPKAFIGYILFLLALLYISYAITVSMPNVLGYAEDINISELLSDTNKMREDRGLNKLTMNNQLSRAAEAKANDMFAKNYWAHTSPDGKEPWDFIIASGYDYLYAGENLAVDFNKSQSVVNAWYDSPSHRENLLNSKYTEIGFAVVNGELEGRKTTLVVQMFGYPRIHAAAVPEAVTSDKTEEDKPIIEVVPAKEVEPEPVVEETKQEPAADTDQGSQDIDKMIPESDVGLVLNASDVLNFSRFIAIIFGLFVTVLFAIDGYYIRKMGVFRVSGHTILHVVMLIAAVAAIWYTQVGLVL
jgi:hypothetical protein